MIGPVDPAGVRWGLPSALVVLAALLFGGIVGGSIAMSIWGPDATTNAWALAVIFVAQGVGAFAAMIWVTVVRGQQSLAKDFGFRAYVVDLMWLPAGVGLQILCSIALLPIMDLIGQDGAPQGVARTFRSAPLPAQILLALCVAVGAPVIEELVFRGVLLRALQRHCSAPLAVLVSAVAFAGMHLLDSGAWLVLPALFAVGVLAGFLANRTGRLGPPIALHAGFNLVALAAILLTS